MQTVAAEPHLQPSHWVSWIPDWELCEAWGMSHRLRSANLWSDETATPAVTTLTGKLRREISRQGDGWRGVSRIPPNKKIQRDGIETTAWSGRGRDPSGESWSRTWYLDIRRTEASTMHVG